MPGLKTTRDELVDTTCALAAVMVFTLMQRDIGLTGGLIGFSVLGLVVGPLSILGHELGHALAVSRLARRGSMVIVGRGPFLRFRTGRTVVLFSLLPTRGAPFSGISRYDSSGLPWRTIGQIALAGPLATAAELVGLAVAAPLLWAIGPLTRFVLLLTVDLLVWSLVRNLRERPLTAPAGRTSSWLRDGNVARQAFAHHRAGTPPRAAATPVH